MEIQPQPQIFDVDEQNFEELVLQSSQERVIVVDFWAPWCGPCKTLGPILEDVVAALGPGVALAKINVDENQQLAMAFRVQGIPAVKIVKNGQLAQEFTGALPREQIEAILRPLVSDAPIPEAQVIDQADDLAATGDLDEAARQYEQMLEENPTDGPALLGLAKIHLQQGRFETVQELVNLVESDSPEYPQAQALLTQIEFAHQCQQAGGRAACAQRALSQPDDPEAHYLLACCAASEGDYETALQEWLHIVGKKSNGDQAAKDAMVAVFHLLGRDNPLVASYQRKLYQALY
jgi:putative thioredoxin